MEVCNNKVFGNNISMDGLESRWSKRRPLLAFTSALSLSPSKQLMLLFKNFSGIVFKTRKIWIVFSMKSSQINNIYVLDITIYMFWIFLFDSILILLSIQKNYFAFFGIFALLLCTYICNSEQFQKILGYVWHNFY